MNKSIKPKNNTYIDSTGVVHNRKLLSQIINEIGLITHPVGSIYMSVDSTNPASLFGGTWEQIKDRFLLASGNTYQAGTIGGEASHTLSNEELPDMVTVRSNTGGYGNQNWAGRFEGWGNYQNNTRGATVNQPHNNMPPYLTVYVWKRTA